MTTLDNCNYSLSMNSNYDGQNEATRLVITEDNSNHPQKVRSGVRAVLYVALLVTLLAIIVTLSVLLVLRKTRQDRNPSFTSSKLFVGKNGAVASDIPECSEIGLSILRDQNGNAVDSAIATCFCIGVIGSYSSGIGGGAAMLVFDGDNVEALDFREMAPLNAHRDMFNLLPRNASERGGLSIAVPGEVKGLYAAWKRYGTLPWRSLVSPSIKIARSGYKVSKIIAKKISLYEDIILNDIYGPGMREIYAPEGRILKAGDIARNEKLANTLEAIAEGGEAAFYDTTRFQLARDIVDDIQKAGGIVNETDLSSYRLKVTHPLTTYYKGYKIHGAQPEISGGPCVLFIMNLLERYNIGASGFNSFHSQHLLVEAMKFAFGHRMELGDPDFTAHLNSSKVVNNMLNKDYASMIRRFYLHEDKTVADYENYSPRIDGEAIPLKASVPNHGTAHFSVVDSNRMAVAMTATINLLFGSMVVGEKTGILFNDEMDDFSVPNRPNAYNIPPSEANFIAPGKRPLSSMAPTIVLQDGKFKMAVGASGGPFITTATSQVLLNVLEHGMQIHEAISSPRFHHQLLPPYLYYEKPVNHLLERQLEEAGHELSEKSELGVSQGILASDDGSTLYAASDSRKQSLAAAY